MKAQDYLESLKAGYRHFSYLVQIAQLPHRAFAGDPDQPKANKRALPLHIQEEAEKVMDEHGQSLTDEQREAFWKHIERMEASQVSDLEWPQIIHQRFMTNVSDEARNTLRGKDIAVGLLRDASFNGSALKVPDSKNGWVIAMNEGYSTIIYSFARTLASTFKMMPSKGGEETLPTLTAEDAAASLFDMLRHYLFVGVPIQKREQVSDPHLFLAWKLADMAEKFIYAHEIAHILLGHDIKAAQHDLPVAFEDSSEISPSVQEEIDADLLGWVLLVKVILPEDGGISEGDLQLAYAGTRLFLRIAQLLEYPGNITVTGTHPPTADRLDYMCIAGQSTAEEFNAPFEMLKAIDNAMQDAMAKLEQALPPLPWQSPVAEIIKEAVVATSQHGFFSLLGTNTRLSAVREFLWLLSYGASGKLCRELGRTMGKAMLELEALGIDLTIEETSDAPPYRPEVIKASLPAFTVFWLISALESAYLPREISRFIEHHRQCYLEEQKHAA